MAIQLFSMATCGIILLAAGASTRMGQVKQLLNYQGESLLQHSVQCAVASSAQPVIAVIGAHADEVQQALKQSPVHTVLNEQWSEGMASSIRRGLSALLKLSPSIDAAILMVCDQPFLSPSLLNDLINKHAETGKAIVASAYAATLGTPALFHKSYFPLLLELNGNEGAKKIIFQHGDDVTTVPFPSGQIDIDTPQDYEALKQKDNNA